MTSHAITRKCSLDSPASISPAATSACWHEDFLDMLPKIQEHASYHFRNLQGDNRDEVIQEVTCNACLAFSRLVEQGRAEAATWSSLAKYAVAQVRAGRRVGSSLNVKDVSLTHQQDGKPKVFRDTAITNLAEFFERFQRLNIRSNEQLDELVEQAQGVVRGVQPQQLRENHDLRASVAGQLETVQQSLDELLVDRPRRNILRKPR